MKRGFASSCSTCPDRAGGTTRSVLISALGALVIASGIALATVDTALAAATRPAASVASRTANVDVNRNVQLLLRCNRSGSTCRGTVVLRPRGQTKRIGKKSYRIQSGRGKLVTVRLSPAAYARLLAAERLSVEASATTRRGRGKTKTKRRNVALAMQPTNTSTPPAPTTDSDPATDPAADKARADRIALELSDLPAGWTTGSDDGSASSECSIPGSDSVSGRHPFTFFATGLATSAGSDVAVLNTVADAISAYNVVPGKVNTCFADLVGSTIDGAKVKKVAIRALASPGAGDRSEAFRIEIEANSLGLDLTVVVDVVYIQRERAFSVLLFTELLKPIDAALKDRLVSAIATRMINSGQ